MGKMQILISFEVLQKENLRKSKYVHNIIYKI